MMDTAQEGIWLLDHEGKVTYTNQRLATMLGYSVDEMVGQPYFEFMDDAARNEAAAHFDSCQQGTGEQYDFCYRRRDGTDLWAIVCASPLRAADGSVTGALALITDISRRKRAEAGILRQAARAEALLQTAARLNEHLDLDTLLHSVCREAAAALQAPAAWINLYDAQQDALCYAADAGMPPAFKDGYQPVLRAQYEAAGGDKGPLVILAEQQETGGMRNQALYSALNIRWVALASMVQDGQLIGTISTVSFDQARRFSEDDLGLLQGVADQAALMIANARLFEQVKAGRVQMSALSLALLDATETERRALALELHDELGQVLNRVKLSLDMAPLLGKEGEREQYLLASSLVLDLIRRVQRISLDLRPSILDDLGLLPALEWLFNTYNEQNGCQVQFKSDGLDQRFPARVEVAAYRIVQESLTNISRHAADKNAGVEARADGEALYISVSDQGGGFDVQAALGRRNSTGLSGMRERARQLGGELGIISTPGQGTRISVRLPLVSGTGP